MELHSKHSKDTWRFTAKEQSKEVSGWEISKGRHQGRGILSKLTSQNSF